jgi:hypothetical protein
MKFLCRTSLRGVVQNGQVGAARASRPFVNINLNHHEAWGGPDVAVAWGSGYRLHRRIVSSGKELESGSIWIATECATLDQPTARARTDLCKSQRGC